MATYRSVSALVERLNEGAENPTFTNHSMRHYVRESDSNGLAPHIKRLGRKILIDEEGFMQWLESHDHAGKLTESFEDGTATMPDHEDDIPL